MAAIDEAIHQALCDLLDGICGQREAHERIRSAIAAALDEDRDDFFWETIMAQKAAMGGGAIGTASAAIAYVRRALLGTEEETTDGE